ncbi:MAG: hypothetical protein B7Y53_05030 [Halothiobacillus sp. 28-55-5]|nr:MAG: hypothetical protein B7Y53_05030 [Halothiobacillus sp. 28-55-5]
MGKRQHSRSVKDRFELMLARLFCYLPIPWVSSIGGGLGARQGRKAIRANRLWVRRMHKSYATLMGITDQTGRERRIIEHTRHVGQVYAEIPVLHRLVRENRLEIIGLDYLEHLTKPVILVSAHTAHWELIGRVTELVGGRFCDIYLPLNNSVHAQLAHEMRSRWQFEGGMSGDLIPASPSAMRQITKAVAQGSNVVLFIDEEKNGTVQSPQFGRGTGHRGNLWFATRLAVRYGLDILPVHIEPNGLGCYRAIIEPKLSSSGEGDAHTKACVLADKLDHQLTSWIRQNLDHWYWLPLLDIEEV